MPALPGFIGQAYRARSKAIDSQLCINLYPEIEQQSSKNVIALIGTPGLASFSSPIPSSGSGGRGMYYSGATDRLFAVMGNTLFELSTTGTATSRGAINTSEGDVRFCEGLDSSGNPQVFLVDGLSGYYFDTSTDTLTLITDAAFPSAATHCANISGYYLVNDSGTGNFYWSTQDDPSTWSALDFANAEGSPDALQGLIVNRNELWLVGSQTVEVWYVTGATASTSRFQKIPGTLRDKGTIAPASIQSIHDHVFYLGSGKEGYGIVWMSQGYEMQRISTPAIEYELRSYTDLTDAIGFTYQIEGHVFYVLSFRTDDKTWVYDISTSMWHQWAYWDQVNVEYKRAKALYQSYFNGKNYVLDNADNTVYELSLDTYSDNGDEIRRVRSSPHVHADRKRIFYHSFEVDIESGVGLTTGQGDDPQIALEISNDGGYSFGSELWTGMGKIGERTMRAHWHRLGCSRDRVFKVIISDPVKVILINANMEVSVG